jgi:hypothetical protein
MNIPLSSNEYCMVLGERSGLHRWRSEPSESKITNGRLLSVRTASLARVVVGLTMTPVVLHAGTGTPT